MSIYKDEILEHFNDPQNFGKLESFSINARQTNPFCGDDIELFIKLNNNKVEDIGFTGKGCAISIASASILTEFSKQKKTSELLSFSEKDMLDLLTIDISETRKKCAMLALATLHDALKKYA